MRQGLHIFLKDVRRLRYDIVVVLLLAATFAWSEGHTGPLYGLKYYRLANMADLLKALLPLAWWYLAAQAVYGEPLPGDCQFWVTRPYSWKSLFGAKLLFIAAFVNLPLLISDCVIVTLQGFHPLAYPVALAWHQLAICALLLLPMTALACITKGLAQLVLASLAIPIGLLILGAIFGDGGAVAIRAASLAWIDGLLIAVILLVAALAIMILQYRARRTWLSRVIVGVAILLLLSVNSMMPFERAFALQSHIIRPRLDASSISLVLEPGKARRVETEPAPPGSVRVALPIAFTGVPAGTVLLFDQTTAELYAPGERRPETLWVQVPGKYPSPHSYEMDLEKELYDRVKNASARLRLTSYFSLLGDSQTERMPLQTRAYRVPGVGLCDTRLYEGSQIVVKSGSPVSVTCRAPFRQPARALAGFDNGDQTEAGELDSYSPFPAEFGIGPISSWSWRLTYKAGAGAIVFTTLQPLAHIRRDLDIPNIRLADLAY
jgi:hypothetical protein